MMEIKFRGTKGDGTWYIGDFISDNREYNRTCDRAYILPRWGTLNCPISVKPESVGQYTGLKDKNGTEIYTGDIMQYRDSYDCSTESGYDFEEFINVGQIVFNKEKGRFDITNKSDISYDDWIETVGECEVIGNVFENPELIEIKK